MIEKIYNNIKVKFCFNNPNLLKIKKVIYILKFPNNKVYIGQTIVNLVDRIKQHCHDKSTTYKANTIRKYQTFYVSILAHVKNLDELDDLEIKYISLYKEKSTNLESGGHAQKIVSEKTKKRISQTLIDKHFYVGKRVKQYSLNGDLIKIYNSTKECGKEIKCNYKTIWNACAKHIIVKNYIFIYEDETLNLNYYKNLLKTKEYNKLHTYNAKQVLQYTLEGNFIEKHNSISQASKKVGISSPLILDCCNKKILSAGNYQWRYYIGNNIELKISSIENRYERASKKMSKTIYQYTLDGIFIQEWQNARKAGEYYNINYKNIQSCCVGRRNKVGEFKWSYIKTNKL